MNTSPEPEEEETAISLDPPQTLAAPKPRPFLCPQCPKSYSLQRYLNDHIKVHSPDNPHVCPLCSKVWASNSQLTEHIRSHTGEKLFNCSADGCGMEFVKRHTLEIHMRVHTGEKLEPKPTCAICGTSFSHIQSLNVHNRKFHNPQKKRHPCDKCGKVYVSLPDLNRHLKTHLPDDPQNCPTCGKSCRNGLILKEHMERHDSEGIYKCEHCAKNFKTHKYLKIHIRFVHCSRISNRCRNHVCSFCGLKPGSRGKLAVHLRTHTGEKPFKCTTCSKAFATKTMLRAHLKVHTGEKPEECQFCGRRFARKANLELHIRTHTGETPYKCNKCEMAFGAFSNLKRHRLAIHPEDRWEEDPQTTTHTQEDGQDPLHIPSENKHGLNNNCFAKLDFQESKPTNVNPVSLESETPVALNPTEMGAASKSRPFPCPHCPMTCRLKSHLNYHIKVHSRDNIHEYSYQLTRHMRSHTGERLFKCPVDKCGKELMRRTTLVSHMRIHTGEKMEPKPTCAICGASFAQGQSLKAHNCRSHNPNSRQHPCVTCGRVFITLAELKRHLVTHLPDNPQDCPICAKSCRNGLALKEHVQRHGREWTYQCEHCLKNCKTKDILKYHIRIVHGGQKCTGNQNHVCSFCGRMFGSSSHLAGHLTTHTGETPYKCDKCGKVFRWSSSLVRHTAVAHSGKQQKMVSTRAAPQPKPFLCSQCPKTYSKQNSLNTHMKVHSPDNPHVCPLCNKVFPNDSHLTKHLRSHTGEKLFKCSADGCGKEFAHRYSLELHMRSHHPTLFKAFSTKKELQNHSTLQTEETLYKCDECGKACANSSTLKRHRILVHLRPQRGQDSTQTHAGGVVPMDPMTDTPRKDTKKNDPLAEVMESSCELYLDKEFYLRQLTIPVPRMRLVDAGGGVLELRSGGECWCQEVTG